MLKALTGMAVSPESLDTWLSLSPAVCPLPSRLQAQNRPRVCAEQNDQCHLSQAVKAEGQPGRLWGVGYVMTLTIRWEDARAPGLLPPRCRTHG